MHQSLKTDHQFHFYFTTDQLCDLHNLLNLSVPLFLQLLNGDEYLYYKVPMRIK